MTGTGISQAIPILVAPLLTRIYSPEDFGIFALFMAIVSIAMIMASARYEGAIILTERTKDGLRVLILSLGISFVFSLISYAVLWCFGDSIVKLLKNPGIEPYLNYIPLTIFLGSSYICLQHHKIREKLFRFVVIARITKSASTSLSQVGIGMFGGGVFGLIAGFIIGELVSVLLLATDMVKQRKLLRSSLNVSKVFDLGKRYRNFPIFDLPSATINVMANQLPNILLGTLFGPAYAGFYLLTQRVLQAPITLIATSVLDVFKRDAVISYAESGHARVLFRKTFLTLLAFSLIPTTVLVFLIEDAFVIFFGAEWETAGQYSKILLPALLLRFLANPLGYMMYVAEKQNINMVFTSLLFVLILASLLLSSSPIQVIYFISASYSIYYLFQLAYAAKLAKCI